MPVILALCSLYQNVILIMCAGFNGVFCIYLCSYMSTLYLSTAEAILQKTGCKEKMNRRQRMGDHGVFY